MEGIELEEVLPPIEESEDICTFFLSRYEKSIREDHQHLCAVIGAMSQGLKDQQIPLKPISYFSATVSSLKGLSFDDPVTPALLKILSTVLPRMPPAVLRNHGNSVLESVSGILGHELAVSEVAAMEGLKCISRLIISGDKGSWLNLSKSYGILISFIADERPKVREHCHSCLRDVLQSFQGSVLLSSASEGITNIFNRFLLLLGGSDPTGSTAAGEAKAARKVLSVLSALKHCLPLMSLKFATDILKCFKELLGMRLVPRHVMNILHALCSSPSSEIAPEVVLDLLCSLAPSLPVEEKSADGMTFVARLVHVGVEKVYSKNRNLCVVKLPIIFSALAEILAHEHEEAIFAAMNALKGLILVCIDESLIKQGVDQINFSLVGGTRRSAPTIIEKLCAITESLLGYQYSAVWDISFQVLSTMFDKLGESSQYLMAGTIKSLADMEKLPDEDLAYRKQLHDCVGSALGAVEPNIFLRILPLNLEIDDLSETNAWLLPVLKQHIVGAHLSFFTKDILGLVGRLRQKSRKLEEEGRIVLSRSMDSFVHSLWSLLPSFCNYPIDTVTNFEGLINPLRLALSEETNLHGIICSSLQRLIQQNREIIAENTDLPGDGISIPHQRARDRYTPQVAADNLNVIKLSSSKFFLVLSQAFSKSPNDSGGCLLSTIREFASVAEKKEVKKWWNNVKKLLKEAREAAEQKQLRKPNSMHVDYSATNSLSPLARAKLYDLAACLLPGLSEEAVNELFDFVKEALESEEGLVQKKGYKVLSIILRECGKFFSSKLLESLEEKNDFLVLLMRSCDSSAKRHRLDCIYSLIMHVAKDPLEQRKQEIIILFLTEIVLSLKEANRKTRNRAYDLLIEIGRAYGDEDQGGEKEKLQSFFSMVAGGLAGQSPEMISASVKGLARLAYEFSDLVTAAYSLLPSAFLLLQRKNREIIKASLGLIKVLVAKSQAETLHTYLKLMVEGLLRWQDDTKNHFKAKVKFLLEMLVRKCGVDAVKALMPEEHMKLLTNIRKIKERKERRIAAKSEDETKSVHSRASTSRLSRWNHTNIFSDFGDEDADDSEAEHMEDKRFSDGGSKAASQFYSKGSSVRLSRKRRATKSLPDDFDQLEDDPLDLLDRKKTRLALRSSEQLKHKAEFDDELEIDADGRLVIHEERRKVKQDHLPSDCMETRSQAGARSVSSSLTKGQKRRKTSDSGWAYTGNEYTNKKAGGDVKRKDKLEPYAYWPLDRKMLSRREDHKVVARKGMTSVLKLTKKLEGKSSASALSSKSLKFKRKSKKGSRKSR